MKTRAGSSPVIYTIYYTFVHFRTLKSVSHFFGRFHLPEPALLQCSRVPSRYSDKTTRKIIWKASFRTLIFLILQFYLQNLLNTFKMNIILCLYAGVAQLVVHSIRNRKVMGPSPITSSTNFFIKFFIILLISLFFVI